MALVRQQRRLTLNSVNPLSAPVDSLSAPVHLLSAPVDKLLFNQLPPELQKKIGSIPQRNKDHILLSNIILELCKWRPLKSSELVNILGRTEKYLIRNFITPLRDKGKLEYIIQKCQITQHRRIKRWNR